MAARRVLVTGASGFLGSHLSEALVHSGYRVRCMVRDTSDLKYIQHLPVDLAYADLQDGAGVREACEGVDAVCHCAGRTRALDEETFSRINGNGTAGMAQACLDVNPRLWRFLYVSSQAAVGPSPSPNTFVDETTQPHPITWYGTAKLAGERALRAIGGRLPLTIVRPAPVFGPRDHDFYTYFKLVKTGLALKLGRDPRRISLIYIHDIVDLILLALDNDRSLGQTYMGSGYETSYIGMSEAIARALNKRIVSITLPEATLTPMSGWAKVQARITGRPALLNEQRIIDLRQKTWLCSSDKARRELGFTPKTGFESAVRETADWYSAEGWL